MSIEVNTALAVESNIAQHGAFVSTPGEHRQRYRDRDVDADLTSIDFNFEFTSRRAGLGKDSGAVTVAVVVDDFDCIVQVVRFENYEDGTKDLFSISVSQSNLVDAMAKIQALTGSISCWFRLL